MPMLIFYALLKKYHCAASLLFTTCRTERQKPTTMMIAGFSYPGTSQI